MSDLLQDADKALAELLSLHDGKPLEDMPDDVRSVAGYYVSCKRALSNAASDIVRYRLRSKS